MTASTESEIGAELNFAPTHENLHRKQRLILP
jgi:hypothetical protein